MRSSMSCAGTKYCGATSSSFAFWYQSRKSIRSANTPADVVDADVREQLVDLGDAQVPVVRDHRCLVQRVWLIAV